MGINYIHWSQDLNIVGITQQRLQYQMKGESYELIHQLRQQNKYEDILDVFINFLIKRSPTIFILINMTLMIWLVQTIYSSKTDQVPRSIHFYTLYMTNDPIIDIEIVENRGNCPSEYELTSLKTFPTIKNDSLSISKANLKFWGSESIAFCLRKRKQTPDFTKEECPSGQSFCSGFCEENQKNCPITTIRAIKANQVVPPGFEALKGATYQNTQYVVTRQNKNQYIVGLSVQYEAKCANDYRYYKKYDSFDKYWNQTKDCGNQGKLPLQIFKNFDKAEVKQFFSANNIWNPSIERLGNEQAYLGSMNLIKFSNKSTECSQAEKKARTFKNEFLQEALKPSFTQSMLIINFVFFVVSCVWVVGYYCFEGSKKQKNMIVVLICIIELIVVSFLYGQNIGIFRTEELVSKISQCLETKIEAASHWSFGITNSSPFLSIMFCCVSFLLFQIISHLIDKKVYVNYQLGDMNEEENREQSCCPW